MAWEIEFEAPFGRWWERLSEDEQETVDFVVQLLGLVGPFGSPVDAPRAEPPRRPVHEVRAGLGRPFRIVYTWDARRSTIVLLGGGAADDTVAPVEPREGAVVVGASNG